LIWIPAKPRRSNFAFRCRPIRSFSTTRWRAPRLAGWDCPIPAYLASWCMRSSADRYPRSGSRSPGCAPRPDSLWVPRSRRSSSPRWVSETPDPESGPPYPGKFARLPRCGVHGTVRRAWVPRVGRVSDSSAPGWLAGTGGFEWAGPSTWRVRMKSKQVDLALCVREGFPGVWQSDATVGSVVLWLPYCVGCLSLVETALEAVMHF